jgi:hypothetical protein
MCACASSALTHNAKLAERQVSHAHKREIRNIFATSLYSTTTIDFYIVKNINEVRYPSRWNPSAETNLHEGGGSNR